jgi:hypothetical protein
MRPARHIMIEIVLSWIARGRRVGLGRTFRIHERVTVNLKMKFNLFNRAEMSNPVATSAEATQTRMKGRPRLDQIAAHVESPDPLPYTPADRRQTEGTRNAEMSSPQPGPGIADRAAERIRYIHRCEDQKSAGSCVFR